MSAMFSLMTKIENDDNINCGAWSQITTDGVSENFIVTGDSDSMVKVWKLNGNEMELVHQLLEDCSLGIVSLAVSPNGSTIASISMDDNLAIWDLQSGRKVNGTKNIGNDYWKSAFCPSGEYLALVGRGGDVVIVDVSKCAVEQILETRENTILCIDWSPDGSWLAAGAANGKVHTFDVSKSGVHRLTLQAHKDTVRDVAFSPNSKLVASASMDGTVKIFNAKSGLLKGTLEHKSGVTSVSFSKDGSRIAVSGIDGCVTVASSSPKRQKTGESDDVKSGSSMTSISNGNAKTVTFAATEKTGTESLELEVLNVFHEHTQAAWCAKFNAEGTKLMSVSADKFINIYGCPPLKKK